MDLEVYIMKKNVFLLSLMLILSQLACASENGGLGSLGHSVISVIAGHKKTAGVVLVGIVGLCFLLNANIGGKEDDNCDSEEEQNRLRRLIVGEETAADRDACDKRSEEQKRLHRVLAGEE